MLRLIKRVLHKIGYYGKRYYLLFTKGTIGYARYLGVTIGDNCRIYIREFGSEPFLISIGNKVTITAGVRLLTHNGSTWLIEDDEAGRRYDHRPISIGNNVFIGVDSIICPGVHIGNQVIIGAGSVVTKSIPDDSVVVGNPAKIISSFSAYRSKVVDEYVSDNDLEPYDTFIDKMHASVKLGNKGFNSYLKK